MRRLMLNLVMLQILILFVAQLMVLVGLNQIDAEGYPDPFAPYEAMMPGQWAVASSLPCELKSVPAYVDIIDCQLQPVEGPFVSASSNVYNGRFAQISFSARDLSVGDIVRRWGRPDLVVKLNAGSFYARWIDQGLVGLIDPVGPFGRFSYMLPVEYFTIGLRQPNNHP